MTRRLAVVLLLLLLSVAAAPAFSQTQTRLFIDERGNPTNKAVDYGRVRIRLLSSSSDLSPTRDTVQSSISSSLGLDSEPVILIETGEKTGIFEGEIDLWLNASPGGDRPGYLDTVRDPAAPTVNDFITTGSGGATATAEVFPSRTELLDAYGNAVTSYPLAGRVYVRVRDGYFNTPSLDTAPATLTASGGDQETLNAVETGIGTGIFETSLPIGTGTPVPDNGVVETAEGETLQVLHQDLNGVTSSAATAGIAAIAARFVDAAGLPASVYLEGSRAYLRVGGKPLDVDPLLRESLPVIVTSRTAGDSEQVLLWETGLATGVYEGSVLLSNGAQASDDGALQTGRTPPQLDTLDVTVLYGSSAVHAEAKTAGSNVRMLNDWDEDAMFFPFRSKVKVRVEAPALPEAPGLRTTQVTMRSPSSTFDFEALTLAETGPGTGIFEGTIALGSGFATADGILQAKINERIEAQYADANGQTTTVAKAFITSSLFWFLDVSGRPTSTLFESAAHKLYVFDFDQVGRGQPFILATSLVGFDQESVTLTSVAGQTGAFEGSLTPVTVTSPQNDRKIRVSDTFSAPDASDTIRGDHYFSTASLRTVNFARTVRSRTRLLDDRGLDATAYVPGAQVQVEVEDHVADATAAADTTAVLLVSTTTGDQETLLLTETGARTGFFRGLLPTTAFAGSPGDGRLRIAPGEAVAATYAPAGADHRSTDTAPVVRRTLEIVDAQGMPATSCLAEGRVRVRVFDSEANADPGQAETLTVEVYSLFGVGSSLDQETLVLAETGPDTSLFTGSVRLSSAESSGALLQTVPGGPPESEYGSVAVYMEDVQKTLRLTDSVLQFLNAQGAVTSILALQTQVRVRLERPRANLNPASAETESVPVRSLTTNDTLTLTVTETGPDTGVFEALLPLATGAASADGTLQAQAGETVEVRKTLGAYLVSMARATVVTRPNVAPIAVNDSATTNEDTAVTLPVLANDSDGDGDTLTITNTFGATKGSTRVNADKTVTFTPFSNANGSGGFFYTVADGFGGTATAQVFVTITPVDDPPVANSDSVNMTEDQTATINVLANDSEPDGSPLTLVNLTHGQKGTTRQNANNTVTYTPNLNATGSDFFSYTISDGTNTAQANVFIFISNVNDPPVAVDDAFTMNEDLDRVFSPASNDVDPDSSLSVSGIPSALHGTVTHYIVNNSFTYKPNPNYYGTDVITYTVTDGTYSDQGVVNVTINPVNDEPYATNDGVTTQEDVPATVNVLANDSDVDGNVLGVSAVTQGTKGSVVINPDKTVTYTPNPNVSGTDSFTYTLSDGNGGTGTATVSVTITAVEDPPDARDDSATVNEDAVVNVVVLGNDTDGDGQTLSVTAVTQGTSGTVVINPNKTLTYTPAANFNGTDTFTYTISDGTSTDTATVTVTVTPVNDTPDAVNDASLTQEDAAVNIVVLGNDTDPDGQTLSVTAVTQGTNGAVVINPDKTITYTPAANFNGTDSFTYTVSDGNGGTDTATASVTIAAVNDPPVAVPDVATTEEDEPVEIVVLGNDLDVEGNALSISAATDPEHGEIIIDGAEITYTPDADFNGADTFTYTISDGNGGTAIGTVSVTVTAVNDAPTAGDDAAATNEDSAVTVSVLDNDSDVEEDSLTIIEVTQGVGGTVDISGSAAVYTPSTNFNGADSFTYTVSDGNGGTAIATVSVTVTGVNDDPYAVNDEAATSEKAAVTVSVLDNDSDLDGDSFSIIAVTQGDNGSAAFNGTTVTYVPNTNFNGADQFVYTISDGNGGVASASVAITVSGINDAPVAANDSAATNEDLAVTVSVLGNDGDVDGDPLSISAVTQGSNGSVAISGSAVVYTPNADFNGSDSLSYTVGDGNGGTATATVSITVSSVNDPPSPADDAFTADEEITAVIPVLANDSDLDGVPLTIIGVTQGNHGSTSISGSNVLYTSTVNYNGPDGFSYTVSDGNGGTTTAVVYVTVASINDPPNAVDDSATVNEDGGALITVLANDSDVDGTLLALTAVTQGTHGSVSFGGQFVYYTPNANYNGTDSFTYTIDDTSGGTDTATVTIIVNTVNDGPDAVNDAAATNEDTAVTVSVLANDSDPDGHPLSITGVTQGARGTATVNANGTVTYTPNANSNGSDSFTYTVSDGNGGADSATVSITISGVNDAPDAVNDAAATNEDTAVTISILANDLDADSEALTVTGATQGSRGAVSLNANGTVTYVPAPNTNGVDSFTYTVRDGAGAMDTAMVTVNVAALNDPPVAAADSAMTREGTAVTIDVRANDSDIEGNSLTVTGISQPANGTAAVNSNIVAYTPAINFNGTDTFTYTLSDGQGGTATGTVTVTVKDSLERVAVLATHGVWIQAGADVLSGDVIVNQSGSAPFLDGGSSEISLAGTVTTPAGWDVQANRINVASGSTVASDVFFNQLTGSVTGAQSSPLALPVFANLPAFRTATPGTTDVNVGTNGTRTLAAGSYRDLIVGRKGTVTFTGGIYHFRSIRVDREAKLFFSAAADVRVQQKLSTLQTTTIAPATGAAIDASGIVFFVAGVNGTGGQLSETPKAVEIGTDNVLRANLYVPNGTTWLKDRIQLWGGIRGKDVQVGPNGQVTLDSYWTGQ